MLAAQIIINALVLGCLYACIAIGFSLVWGVLNVINLIHGSIIVLGAYLAWGAYQSMAISPWYVLPVAVPVFFVFGYLLQRLLLNRVLNAPVLVTLTLTFGLDLILNNAMIYFFKADYRKLTLKPPMGSVSLFHVVVPVDRLIATMLALVLTGLLYLLLRHSRVGRAIVAVRLDRDAAILMGVDVRSIYAIAFGIGAALAGCAGVLMALIFPISALTSTSYLDKAFVVCVLGGLGSVSGALAGGLLLALVEGIGSAEIGPAYATTLSFALLIALGCVAALPLVGGAYALRLGTMACMYAILALSWNVVGGFAGYPSFATAAFFGFGAYATGVLLNAGVPLTLSILAAFLGSFVLAGLLGAVLLRLRGHYFAIASLSLVGVLRELANNATDLTGGGMGLNIPLASGSSIMADALFFFYGMWGLLLATALMVIAVSASKLGFGLTCIRQNETAANMIGLNATLYKSIAFGLSACFVAAAGGLYAAWVHYIDPSDVFDILYSVKPIVMTLMGGLGSPLGAACGAFLYLGLEEVVWRNYIQIHSGVLGLLIVALLLLLPHGLVSLRFRSFWKKAKHV